MKQTAVKWLEKELNEKGKLTAVDFFQAKEMEKQKEYETKAFWFGRGILAGRENRIAELQPETYGSKGSDEIGQSLEWNGEVTNGNSVEKLPNVASAKEILDFTTKQATEINWGGVVQHIPNICNCHQSNCHLINGKYICASCNKTLNVETQHITSSQTEISDEEIEAAAKEMFYNNSDSGWHVQFARNCFKEGAKWMENYLKPKQ